VVVDGLSVVVVVVELLSLEVVLVDVVVWEGVVAVSEGVEVLLGEEEGFDVVGTEVEGAVVDGAVELSPPPPRHPLATAIPIISNTNTNAVICFIHLPPNPQETKAGVYMPVYSE
jgi:hypothetical protein